MIAQLAIADVDGGNITFYKRTDSGGEMSSIHKSTCATVGGYTPRCVEYTVATATCTGLLSKYGVPLLLKVDIEGADALCINSLNKSIDSSTSAHLPAHLSTEDMGLLQRLGELGYTRFKVSDASTPSPIGWQALSKFSGGLPETIVSMAGPGWQTAGEIKASRAFRMGDLVAALPASA